MPSEKDKIQKLELETVKAVTELKKDVQHLSQTITSLQKTIEDMANNYVRKDELIQEITLLNGELIEIRKDLEQAKSAGRVRAILWSLFTAVITSVVIYEATRLIR